MKNSLGPWTTYDRLTQAMTGWETLFRRIYNAHSTNALYVQNGTNVFI